MPMLKASWPIPLSLVEAQLWVSVSPREIQIAQEDLPVRLSQERSSFTQGMCSDRGCWSLLHLSREFKENKEMRLGNAGRQARVLCSWSQFYPQQSSFSPEFPGAARQPLRVGLSNPGYSSPTCRGWSHAHRLPQPLCDLGELAGQYNGHMPKIRFYFGSRPAPWATERYISPPEVPQSPCCLGKVKSIPSFKGWAYHSMETLRGTQVLRHGGFSTSGCQTP